MPGETLQRQRELNKRKLTFARTLPKCAPSQPSALQSIGVRTGNLRCCSPVLKSSAQVLKSCEARKGSASSLSLELNQNFLLAEGWVSAAFHSTLASISKPIIL